MKLVPPKIDFVKISFKLVQRHYQRSLRVNCLIEIIDLDFKLISTESLQDSEWLYRDYTVFDTHLVSLNLYLSMKLREVIRDKTFCL